VDGSAAVSSRRFLAESILVSPDRPLPQRPGLLIAVKAFAWVNDTTHPSALTGIR
jgi:hypothetical protein